MKNDKRGRMHCNALFSLSGAYNINNLILYKGVSKGVRTPPGNRMPTNKNDKNTQKNVAFANNVFFDDSWFCEFIIVIIYNV